MKNAQTLIVIPARYASTRFPGKPLAPILGKPMIQWVWEAVSQNRHQAPVIIATDDDRIAQVARSFRAQVLLTSPSHRSGTDRVAEVARQLHADLWINVQGDEPLIHPHEIDHLIDFTLQSPWDIATLAHPITHQHDWLNPNIVKVLFLPSGQACYFSRAPIPYSPSWPLPAQSPWRHIGIYAYRSHALLSFVQCPPTPWELAENLEQLRALHLGLKIGILPTTFHSCGVDRPEDIPTVENLLRSRSPSSQHRREN